MKLYFLRHGLAADRSEWEGSDYDRPLTSIGVADMRRTAHTIDYLQLELDLILSSPLKRALQTAQIVGRHLNMLDKVIEDKRLDTRFNMHELRSILKEYDEVEDLMLVGHEPSLSTVIGRIIGGKVVMKKGALARIDLTDESALKGELEWLLPPKVLVR